ncbi:MAG: hypothetical protein OER86_05690 [Phycisphaerae bacterium]|nr:hypothetical protein [Phycisphaerae bacterium]
MQHVKRFLIVLLSAGWLVPAWLSLYSYFGFLGSEVWPRLRGEIPTNSFPFTHFSLQAMTIAAAWLALAIIYWAWMAMDRQTLSVGGGEEPKPNRTASSAMTAGRP